MVRGDVGFVTVFCFFSACEMEKSSAERLILVFSTFFWLFFVVVFLR